MKTIVRFYMVIIFTFIGLAVICTSCLKDEGYSIGDYIISFGTIEMKSPNSNNYVIHLDDGNNVVPVNSAAPLSQIKDNGRVWVNFNPLSDSKLTDSTVTYLARINSIKEILFKDIKKFTQVSDDSMGHDPIDVQEAWISKTGGILTLELKYFTQGSVHYINLIDNGESNGIVNPFVLELRHNARGDQEVFPATAFVSFKLDYLKLTGKSETRFFIRYTDYTGRRIDLPLTYKY